MKKINKRKYKLPVRYVPPNRRYPSWKALNIMYNHHRRHNNPSQIKELSDLADLRQWEYGDGPLSNPFELEDQFLKTGINRAKRENFHMKVDIMRNKPGWFNPLPGNERSGDWFDYKNHWITYNDDVQHDYAKHLKTRQQHRDYERLDNHILRKFKW